VKGEIFHMMVFIPNPTVTAYSKFPHSLCQKVCTHLNITDEHQEHFWKLYSKVVVQKLNCKRSDVSTALKKVFRGKSSYNKGQIYKIMIYS